MRTQALRPYLGVASFLETSLRNLPLPRLKTGAEQWRMTIAPGACRMSQRF